jgi:lysozyme
MKTNLEGIILIKGFENCKLSAYPDGGGVWTIGYGHTGGVKMGDVWTQEHAETVFLEDIFEREMELNARNVLYLTGNQFSALVSFLFNVGPGSKGIKDGLFTLKSGDPSTLWRAVLDKDFMLAGAQFPLWCRIDGERSEGLLRRRVAEQKLFMTADPV